MQISVLARKKRCGVCINLLPHVNRWQERLPFDFSWLVQWGGHGFQSPSCVQFCIYVAAATQTRPPLWLLSIFQIKRSSLRFHGAYLLDSKQPMWKTKRSAGVAACSSKSFTMSCFRFKFYTFELQIKLTELKGNQASFIFFRQTICQLQTQKKTGEEESNNRSVCFPLTSVFI